MPHPEAAQRPWFESPIRVRYADTDQMGVVHHAKFLEYFEQGRSDWLRSAGLSYREIERGGVFLAVTEARVRYHRPAHYDDLLTVCTAVEAIRHASLTLCYRLRREQTLLATGVTTLAALDRDGRPRRLPEPLLERLRSAGRR